MATNKVRYGEQLVGSVEITKEGLYYIFVCRCKNILPAVYRLQATCGDGCIDMGVCLFDSDGLYLRKRLPISRFSSEISHFELIEDSCIATEEVALCENVPFLHFDRIRNSSFKHCNGQAFLILHRRQDTGSASS